jgi:hypothetical protein
MAVFWVAVPCSLVEPDYTVLQSRRQPSPHSPPWEPRILLDKKCYTELGATKRFSRRNHLHGDSFSSFISLPNFALLTETVYYLLTRNRKLNTYYEWLPCCHIAFYKKHIKTKCIFLKIIVTQSFCALHEVLLLSYVWTPERLTVAYWYHWWQRANARGSLRKQDDDFLHL